VNIEGVLSTSQRVGTLRSVLLKSENFGVSEVSREVGLSKGFVSGYLRFLADSEIIERSGKGFKVVNNVKVKALKILQNLNSIDVTVFERHPFVEMAGLYGSWAKGNNNEKSDIDLWIIVKETSEEELATLSSDLRNVLGPVKPLYLTREKLRLMRSDDEIFYYSLMFGSITLYGEGLEEIRI
jgi:predicted nucleotidyltransferase